MHQQEQKKMDWHLFWTAASVIMTLGALTIGCYVNLRSDLDTIKTVLIMRGIMPESLANEGNP